MRLFNALVGGISGVVAVLLYRINPMYALAYFVFLCVVLGVALYWLFCMDE